MKNYFIIIFGYKNGRLVPEAASVCVLLARQLLREGPRGKTKSSAVREQSEGGEGRGEERHVKGQEGESCHPSLVAYVVKVFFFRPQIVDFGSEIVVYFCLG